uniref:Arginine and glutamate-rich protein 1 n=1 Tax=Bursaphelenchus xylophilus TaxID=6326 RepID=A0A1I7RJA1_BURXY
MARSRSRDRDDRRRSRYRSRSRSRNRDRSRDRDRDSERRKDRHHKSHRRRKYSSSRSPSTKRTRSRSPPKRPTTPKDISPELNATHTLTDDQMPDDVKKDLCQQDWAPNKMTGAALKWVTETVNEQMRARNEEIDAVVRDRIQKAKVELEARLRAQIENEWKDEMEAARKREADTLARLKDMEKSLEDRRKELDLEKDKMNEERLQMLEAKSKAEMERNQLKEELDKLKKTEQHSILNKGGFQRAPIKFGFKS